MEHLSFLVQGSSSEPYEVIFARDATSVSVHCTCQAGIMGTHCKHRMRIIAGSVVGLVNHCPNELQMARSWVSQSNIPGIIQEFEELSAEEEEIKQRLRAVKKRLAAALLGYPEG